MAMPVAVAIVPSMPDRPLLAQALTSNLGAQKSASLMSCEAPRTRIVLEAGDASQVLVMMACLSRLLLTDK